MTALLAVTCGALGLFVGSLLNVVIQRVPPRQPVRPLLVRCQSCDRPRTGLDALPVVGWFRGRGRCRECGEALPVSIPLVEVGTALLFAAAALRFGTSLVLVPYLLLFAALLAVSVIDLAHYRIPDRIVFPTLGLSLPLVVAVSLVEDAPKAITGALAGLLLYFVLLFIPHLVYPRGMGFGDVKLALVMGLYLGWLSPLDSSPVPIPTLVLFGLVIGSLLGTVGGLAVAVVRRRRDAFPFGPALAASTVIAVLFSEQLLL